MRKKKIFILGFLGYYNLGDDLMLDILNEKLKYENTILLVKKNYYNQKAIYRYNLLKIFFSIKKNDILINLGGIFQDTTSFRSFLFYWFINMLARFKGGKIILLNIDAVDIKRKTSFYLLEKLVKYSSVTCFRDKISYNRYKHIKSTYYIPDIVFLFKRLGNSANRNYSIINPVKKICIKKKYKNDILLINKGEEKLYKHRPIIVYDYKNIKYIINKIRYAERIITGRYHTALIGLLYKKNVEFLWGYRKLKIFYNEFFRKKMKKNIDNKNKRVYNIQEIKKEWKKIFIYIKKELN